MITSILIVDQAQVIYGDITSRYVNAFHLLEMILDGKL